MPEITISDDTYARVVQFKKVAEVILEEEGDGFGCNRRDGTKKGLDAILADLMAPQDQITLLRSIQQLASRYPAQVYEYIVQILEEGVAAQQREALKCQMGFSVPNNMKE